MKKYKALILALSLQNCYSEDIKLQCDLAIKRIYTSGTIENEIQSAIVEITSIKMYLSIIITGSEPLISIQTKLRHPVLSVDNNSDRNSWNLANVIENQKAGRPNSTNTISIDRNTGYLNYQKSFENGLYTTGAGYCKKIDTTARKF